MPTVSASTAASATRSERRSRAAAADAAGDGDRFVVQEHHATRLHWDLRLEHDGVAASWAIPNGIPEDPHENRLAVRTEDHPLEYLDFEGDIPKGEYGAGTMRIWDRGTYERHKFDDDKVEVTFHGERLRGRYGLFPLKRRKGEPPGKDWMIHRMDPAEDPTREPMPERLVPMLAKPGRPAARRRALGLRDQVGRRARDGVLRAGRLRFESRNRNDITASYPELRALNRALSSHRAILDGEIVAFDEDGRPSFGRLQSRMHVSSESTARRRAKDVPVAYLVFDLLWLDGHSLMELPYEQRRARLRELELQGAHWQTPDHHVGDGAAMLEASRASGLEGVVAKRLDSPYLPGRRSPCWLKVKNVRREDVVVGGWLPGEGKRRERIGALLVGVPEDGRLRYAGRVGTGFSDAELDRLAAVLEQRPDSPFGGEPALPRDAVFVEPTRVAEVEFTEWTSDGMLRHPSYKGLREEAPSSAFLDAGSPVRDGTEVRVGGRTLKVTNLDKVMYPAVGFTKRDVIEYYVGIAPAILPHLEGRPLTRVRFPNGVDDKSFFEKQCPSHRPDWVAIAPVPLSKKIVEFCVCNDLPTLVWLANLAALELHTQLHRAEALGGAHDDGLRPRPGTAGDDRRVLPRRAAAAGHVREPRPAGVREDVGLQGAADLRAAQLARRDVRAHEGLRARGRRAARVLRARSRRRADEQGRAQGQGLHRLQPERRAQDDRLRVLAARARATDRLDAGHVGRGARLPRGRRSAAARLRRRPGASRAWRSTATCSRPCSRSCSRCRRSGDEPSPDGSVGRQLRPGAIVAITATAATSVAIVTNAMPSGLRPRARIHRRSRRVTVLA